MFTLAASRLIPVFVGLISFPLLTRVLSPEQYGQLSLINSLVGLTSMCAVTWISSSVHRYYVNDLRTFGQSTVDRYVFEQALPVSIAIAFVGLGFLFLSYTVSVVLIVAAFTTVAIQSYYATAVATLQSQQRFLAALIFELCKAFTYVGLLVLFVYGLNFGVSGAVWAAALSGVTALLFLVGRKGSTRSETDPGSGYLKKFAAYGLPMTVSSIGAWTLQLSDRWFLVSFHTEATVGIYAANYSLIEFIVRNPMQMILLFISLQLFRMDNTETAVAKLHSLRPYILIGMICVVGLAAVFGNVLIGLLANSVYQQPRNLQIVLAIAQGLQIIAMFESIALQLRHRTVLIMTATLMAAVLNLFLNYLLVPIYAAEGAAIATMTSYFALTTIIVFGRWLLHSSTTS